MTWKPIEGKKPGDIFDFKTSFPNQPKGKYMVNKLGNLVKIPDDADEARIEKLRKKLVG